MNDLEATLFHKRWLGMLEPIEGLVVSLPVLVAAECMERQAPALSQRIADDHVGLTKPLGKHPDGQPRRAIVNLDVFLEQVLGLSPSLFARTDELPADLELYVPEGAETIRPTLALKKRHRDAPTNIEGVPDASTPQSRAGEPFVMLVADVPVESLDKPDRREGHWAYPPSAKFDRLLRACRVPIGLLTNREEVRLIYAPHGESSGSLTFRVGDLASVGGRDILDAFVMLLSAQRFFGVAQERQLPALLQKSRAHQANVTTELADQVLDALDVLLKGFARAAERDGVGLLEQPLTRGGDYVYGGLLTVLLRLVFLLYAEDRGLLPTEHAPYANDLSVLSLFGQLQTDHGAFPDTMARRYGAWPRLLALFRAVYFGARWGDVVMPARRGELFDPTRYPFLEGWGPEGGAPTSPKERALMRVPSIDDETLFHVLERLLILEGQRLSYRALDVEQIGSVYENLIGYSVVRLDSPAVCLKPNRVWLSVVEWRNCAPAGRAQLLQQGVGLAKDKATKLVAAVAKTRGDEALLGVLEQERVKGTERLAAGDYVLQPSAERRHSSAHYTPKSLTTPIVSKTLEPLLRAMGDQPSSEQLLALKICDPAMGSGAFLVEACRFLGDQLEAAWSREGKLDELRGKTDNVELHARRLVAQRCLYGVDLNPFAVTLARLSLWLVTLAKDEPFTFVDHALRHGDSLVGLTLEQLRAFHWTPPKQLELTSIGKEVDAALEEARGYRERILELAGAGAEATEEKERLLRDAEFALERARIVGDLVIGAFFGNAKDKDRERARADRLQQVRTWFDGEGELPEQLQQLREEVRQLVTPFHWSIEFPEVFYAGRADPLEQGKATGAALMDAFVGNTPFAGKNNISDHHGDRYIPWLQVVHPGAHGNADYCAHFFRRAFDLLGANGTMGFIATKTIAEGDTRLTSLHYLLTQTKDDVQIYDALRGVKWSGRAGVAVSVVHIAKGRSFAIDVCLNGEPAPAINSRLRGKPVRSEPVVLVANAEKSFVGSYVLGMGFTLTPAERDALVRKSDKNAERIFPYIGGEEVNTSPTQEFDRYVINFGTMSLHEAERWPDLIAIVREKVKPERDRLKNTADGRRLRASWWLFCRTRPELYEAIAPLSRCLVTARASKHLLVSFQPNDREFSEQLYVFPLESNASFALLQSRTHEIWAWMASSTYPSKSAEDGIAGLRYSASRCFETFPFPRDATLGPSSAIERAGKTLYEKRAKYMVDIQQGLTQTYNQLKDPQCTEPRVEELRRLHEVMDRAVLDAYGWKDVAVPPYGTPVTHEERKALERFEDEVIDRLFELNSQRAEEERTKKPPAAEERRPGLAKSKPPKAIEQKSESRIKLGVKKAAGASSQSTRRKAK